MTCISVVQTFFIIKLLVTSTAAFLFPQDATVSHNPYLNRFTEATTGQLLQFDLDIAPPQDLQSPSRMYVSNMVVELKNCPLPSVSSSQVSQVPGSSTSLSPSSSVSSTSTADNDSSTTTAKLPSYLSLPNLNMNIGSNLNPLGTNPFQLNVLTPGTFVSMSGTQQVNFTPDSTWEMAWMADRPAGSILCEFTLDKEVRRNDAVLSPGTIYMNLPIWTRDGLMEARSERIRLESRHEHYLTKQNEQLKRSSEAGNPFVKAMHFQKATVAAEKLSCIPVKKYQRIPMEDEELIAIGNDLLLCRQGSIWSKEGSDGVQRNEFQRKRNSFSFVGHVSVGLKKSD